MRGRLEDGGDRRMLIESSHHDRKLVIVILIIVVIVLVLAPPRVLDSFPSSIDVSTHVVGARRKTKTGVRLFCPK